MSVSNEQAPEIEGAPSLDVQREQRLWRERVLRGITLALLACSLGVAAWYAVVRNPTPQMLFVLLGSALIFGGVHASPRLPFALRAILTLSALYVPCAYSVWTIGFAPNAFVGFGAIALAGTLLLGRRIGLWLVAMQAFTVSGIGVLHYRHLVVRVPGWEANLDSSRLLNTVRVVITLTLLSATLVIAISYLLSRSEQLSLEKAHSIQTLRREQLERERIGRDLELHEAAFQKARELELLGRLAGSMAHDFNNALLVIWAALDEIALVPGLPAAATASLADLRLAADQASATARQLRAFGPMGPRRSSTLALGPALEKARPMFARVLPQNIEFSLDLQQTPFIVADEGEVLRVLMNLALNARDAMREGGTLTLRVRPATSTEALLPFPDPTVPAPPGLTRAGVAVIEVEDSGAGMSEEVQRRLFEPFFTTKQASGTGLGLASVRQIVMAHGGRVEVTSELGAGTTIALLWPAVAGPVFGLESPLAPRPNEPTVVLLVDDDRAVRIALQRTLSRAGMNVLEAEDTAAALTTARRHTAPIHVLCTDCVMAGPPVHQLIATFRELHGGRVLVCSGYAPAETGLTPDVFDDFLPKPFGGDALVAKIHSLLRARS